MTKIAFLQSEYEDKLGVLYLIAYLKVKGHLAEMFIEKSKWLDDVKEFQPNILGFSCLTGGHLWVESYVEKIKKEKRWDIPIIIGGSHATFFPQMIENPYIDFICRGEGEYALKELLDKIEKGEDLTSIQNIWAKRNGLIIKNEVRPLITDLDMLPIPDRSHYNKYPLLKRNPHKRMIASRGCPFNCTYCYNSAFKALYKNKGKIVRRRSVENGIQEILLLKQQGGWKTLEFVDDAFLVHKEWFLRFTEKYQKKVNLPYTCFAIAKNIDQEVAEALKRSNCKCVEFGIEAGSEKIRKEIYKKRVSNSDIVRGAELLHQQGIKFLTFNMVGAPFETIEEMGETIRLNQQIKTDYPWCSIMQPYPGTEIFAYCLEKGLIDNKTEIDSFTYFEKSILRQENQKTIKNVQKLFFMFSKFPFLNRFYKTLVKLPLNNLYTLIFYICYTYSLKKRYSVNIRHLILYWMKLRETKKLASKKKPDTET
ncbi:MAG: B12-binding domain-containing radical SAM protein [Deltaproteobacteria bacterium]|nr:B12-binding domain-containing radical SAM protein [Deltaproteobacteria bacterium]